MPKISVIIPNYNHALYLEQRIDSVVNQIYQDFEVIILDDCSTDNSREIIERYRNHPKIKALVYNTTNSGSTFLQWKKGIDLAQGDWIWIAESDDFCEPSFLNELIKGEMTDGNCTVSFCQSISFKDNRILWASSSDNLEHIQCGKEFTINHMLKRNAIFNASMVIFKKATYDKISMNYLKYKFIGDWLFWIELASEGTIFISGKTLNYFRSHPKDVTSITATSGLLYKEYFQLLKDIDLKYQSIGKRKTALVKDLHKQFRLDENVASPSKIEILYLFRAHLGLHYYYGVLSYYWHCIKSKSKLLIKSYCSS